MGIQIFWVSSKSDPPWQFNFLLEQSLSAVTVKENFHTELRSADPKKVLKDPSPRPETPRNGEDSRENQAKLLRDNVERLDVLQVMKKAKG